MKSYARRFSGLVLVGLAGLVCILGLSACQTPETDGPPGMTTSSDSLSAVVSTLNPAETVGAMLKAYLQKDLGEYYRYVATSDKAVKSLDSLQAEFAPSSTDIVTDFLFLRTKFRIDSMHVVDDSALVFLTSISPPVGLLMQQANVVQRDLGPDTDLGTKMSILSERYKQAGAPTKENKAVYHLVREPSGWKVIVGWAELAADNGASGQANQ